MTIKVTVAGWQDPSFNPDDPVVELYIDSDNSTSFIKFANEVMLWCFENGIDADLVARSFCNDNNKEVSSWHINDPGHRMMFILRWA